MRRNLTGRLERLEQQTGGHVDLDAERARYGEPLWGAPPGLRAYEKQAGDMYRLAIVGNDTTTVYELPGVEGAWLR